MRIEALTNEDWRVGTMRSMSNPVDVMINPPPGRSQWGQWAGALTRYMRRYGNRLNFRNVGDRAGETGFCV